MKQLLICIISVCFFSSLFAETSSRITLGIDRLLSEPSYQLLLKKRRIGLITNHTAINAHLISTISLLKQHQGDYQLCALFAPEHGLRGIEHASEKVENSVDEDGIPVYSLHGTTRRPTAKMLTGLDVLIFDIQDIGVRSYTYISTLFYAMEEAAKHKIKVIVTDRPNPMGGTIVDGLLLDPKWRSFIGYANVTYCHGMTIGELANFFNQEYNIGCDLTVIPMNGWKRTMCFDDTGLVWVPTSPQIPESDTPFFYATTGFLGELQLTNIGIGYTLPFKVVGAPWIDAKCFANKLNAQQFPGVYFRPIYYKPFFGSFAQKDCQGIQIIITNKNTFLPVQTQYLIIGMLKTLYPEQVRKALQSNSSRKDMFCKANGTEEVFRILEQDTYIVFKLKKMCQDARKVFLPIREKYLIDSYGKTN